MPEGHTVHRSAKQFADAFLGKPIRVDSPQGRFSASAALIDGRSLRAARAVGKQLFLEFDNGYTLRIHLGIYGKWRWHSAESLPVPVGEVRARFWCETDSGFRLAELRGPTACELLGDEQVNDARQKLGPDPIHPDPRGEELARFIARIQKSKKAVGLLLMDQSVVSGIGNVYRAELLFRAKLNPMTPGSNLSKETLTKLWADAVKLLAVGVRTGVMITRDEFLKKDPGKSNRHFVYKREGQPCRVCATPVSIAILAGRKLYWCANCQTG